METSVTDALKLLQYCADSEDVLDDCTNEVRDLLNLSKESAREHIRAVLDFYHYARADIPNLPYDVILLIIHVTQPFRLPHMTSRMIDVLSSLSKIEDLHHCLDYGGGGGKDTIIFAKAGYHVAYADIDLAMINHVKTRCALRGLSGISFHDVRQLPDERYDFISCMDVIEHVYDVEYVLADIMARLRYRGHLFLFPAFYNDWTGDHVEKNCGYRPYFTRLLRGLGLSAVESPPHQTMAARLGIMGSRLPLYHLQRTREIAGSIAEEKTLFARDLYRQTYRHSSRMMLSTGLAIPATLPLYGLSRLFGYERGDRFFTRIADMFFDNYAIRRLCKERLASLRADYSPPPMPH